MRRSASAIGRELRFILEALAKGDAGEMLSISDKTKFLSECEAQRQSRLSVTQPLEAQNSSVSDVAETALREASPTREASIQRSGTYRDRARAVDRRRDTASGELVPAFLRRGEEPAG